MLENKARKGTTEGGIMTAAEYYRDYLNDFITIHGFAEFYGLSYNQAVEVLEQGKYDHERGE